LSKPAPAEASSEAIAQAAAALRSGKKTLILIRIAALKERGLHAAGRIAAATGTRIACDTFAPRCRRGAGVVSIERIPYFAEQIVQFMQGTEQLVLVGAKPPVSFFAYPGKPSWCTPEDCRILYLAHEHEDGVAALEALANALKAPNRQPTSRN
jgi:acetolactate synthase-1/2/3 large subunit